MRSALINAGYRVSSFHHDADAVKTDAPNSVVCEEELFTYLVRYVALTVSQ